MVRGEVRHNEGRGSPILNCRECSDMDDISFALVQVTARVWRDLSVRQDARRRNPVGAYDIIGGDWR
jgi:hypothetical protein